MKKLGKKNRNRRKTRSNCDKYTNVQFTGNIDDNLIGSKFNFRARDLIYLLYDIEEKFNIKIPEEDIDNNKFNTIGNIIKIINKELEAKKAEAN